MIFPQLSREALKYNIELESEPLPAGVNGLLLSRRRGCVSIAADWLSPYRQEIAHAVNIGHYAALLSGVENRQQFAIEWADELLYGHNELSKPTFTINIPVLYPSSVHKTSKHI